MKKFSEVVLLVKTERLFDFIEWIEYYKKLGFDHITVYDNESKVNIKSICDRYVDLISYYRIEGFPDQRKLELVHYKNSDYTWVFFADFDEFIWIDPKYKNINNFLMKKSETVVTDFLAIYWVKVSSNPVLVTRPDTAETTQLKAFNYVQEREYDSWIKCFYKTGNPLVTGMEIHYPSNLLGTKDIQNNIIEVNDIRKINYIYDNDDCLLFHFYHRSWEEYDKKMHGPVATRNCLYTEELPNNVLNNIDNYAKLLYNLSYNKYDNRLTSFLYNK